LLSTSFRILTLAHQAELMQISLSFSLSIFMIFFHFTREKSKLSAHRSHISSSTVNNNSRFGLLSRPAAIIDIATHMPLSAPSEVLRAFKNQSSS